jgi:hypothetical protein
MPLTVVRRKSTGALTISGIVAGRRVQRRAQSDDPKLAREEAAALEAEILRVIRYACGHFTWSRSPRPMRWLRSWRLCRESRGPRTLTRSVGSTQADLCRDFFCRAVGLKLSFFEAAYTTRVSPDLGTAQLK